MSQQITFPDDVDGDVLRSIQNNGSNMNKSMSIDFHIAASDELSGNQILATLNDLSGECHLNQDDETQEWTVTYSKKMIPEYDEIIRLQNELNSIAKPLGGYSDGWGTFGNKD